MNEAAKTIVRSRTAYFRDIHVAPVLVNTPTVYETGEPIKLARSIKGKISDKFSTEKLYSDDSVEEVITSYEGTEVELEVNSLAPQDKQLLFGHLYDMGYLVKNKDDRAPEVAVGYRAKKLNGKYEFTWLYVGTFGQGYDEEYETKGEKITTKTANLKGSFYERKIDGGYSVQVDESNLLEEHRNAREAIKQWFSAVQEKPNDQADSGGGEVSGGQENPGGQDETTE